MRWSEHEMTGVRGCDVVHLVDLTPVLGLLLHEPLVDGGHDFVELLAGGGVRGGTSRDRT